MVYTGHPHSKHRLPTTNHFFTVDHVQQGLTSVRFVNAEDEEVNGPPNLTLVDVTEKKDPVFYDDPAARFQGKGFDLVQGRSYELRRNDLIIVELNFNWYVSLETEPKVASILRPAKGQITSLSRSQSRGSRAASWAPKSRPASRGRQQLSTQPALKS